MPPSFPTRRSSDLVALRHLQLPAGPARHRQPASIADAALRDQRAAAAAGGVCAALSWRAVVQHRAAVATVRSGLDRAAGPGLSLASAGEAAGRAGAAVDRIELLHCAGLAVVIGREHV